MCTIHLYVKGWRAARTSSQLINRINFRYNFILDFERTKPYLKSNPKTMGLASCDEAFDPRARVCLDVKITYATYVTCHRELRLEPTNVHRHVEKQTYLGFR